MDLVIKVDDQDYVVFEKDMEEQDGEFCAATQTILLQKSATPGYKRVVLLHELIHACYEHAGSPPEPLAEEQVACLVSRRLLPILRNNPDLVSYLTE